VTDETQARTLLAQLGAALAGTGQPVNEVQEDLREVGRALGFPDAQIAAAATGVTLSLAVGSPSTFAVNPGNLRLDQASEVREIRHYLSRGRLDPVVAMERLATLRTQPTRYPTWLENIGWVICAVGIALIIQPMWAGVAVSFPRLAAELGDVDIGSARSLLVATRDDELVDSVIDAVRTLGVTESGDRLGP
jgi:uncharacterized membrane protein YjjP (DUF1212 family)